MAAEGLGPSGRGLGRTAPEEAPHAPPQDGGPGRQEARLSETMPIPGEWQMAQKACSRPLRTQGPRHARGQRARSPGQESALTGAGVRALEGGRQGRAIADPAPGAGAPAHAALPCSRLGWHPFPASSASDLPHHWTTLSAFLFYSSAHASTGTARLLRQAQSPAGPARPQALARRGRRPWPAFPALTPQTAQGYYPRAFSPLDPSGSGPTEAPT